MDESTHSGLKRQLHAEWASLADDWIELAGTRRNVHREGLLDSWMLEAVSAVRGLDAIDLGCGEGRFSRMLAERGANVTGVDLCEPFIEYAEAHRVGNERYAVGDMEGLDGVRDADFDLAVSYVTLVDVPDLDQAVREAFRVLRPGGRLVVCNLHPMVSAGMRWIKDGQTKLHYMLDDYFDTGPRELAGFAGTDKTLTNFHRPLSSYIRAFLDAGFRLDGLQEPKPTSEQVADFPDIADNRRVPEFIIYFLSKP